MDAAGGLDKSPRSSHARARARGRVLAMLAKPSTELQTDFLAVQFVALIVGVAGIAVLRAAGAAREPVGWFAAVAAAIFAAATYEVARKLRFERHYGEFFSAGVSVTSDDVVDDEGRLLARRGVDEVCELHVISGLGRMAKLNRLGAVGRMRVALETLQGIRALARDMGDPLYERVGLVTARSDLVGLLLRMGFTGIARPPRFDTANRIAKRLDILYFRLFVNRNRHARPEDYHMAVMARGDFTGPEFAEALDGQISRIEGDVVKLEGGS